MKHHVNDGPEVSKERLAKYNNSSFNDLEKTSFQQSYGSSAYIDMKQNSRMGKSTKVTITNYFKETKPKTPDITSYQQLITPMIMNQNNHEESNSQSAKGVKVYEPNF